MPTIKCGYCGIAADLNKKHVRYQSQVQLGKPLVVWCVEPACWMKDPLSRVLREGAFDALEERICLARIQARGPGRLVAGWEWWGPRFKKQRSDS